MGERGERDGGSSGCGKALDEAGCVAVAPDDAGTACAFLGCGNACANASNTADVVGDETVLLLVLLLLLLAVVLLLLMLLLLLLALMLALLLVLLLLLAFTDEKKGIKSCIGVPSLKLLKATSIPALVAVVVGGWLCGFCCCCW